MNLRRSVPEILDEAGLQVLGGTAHQIRYRGTEGARTVELVDLPSSAPLTRRQAERAAAEHRKRTLLICEKATEDARRWVLDTGVIDLAITSTGEVIVGGRSYNGPRRNERTRPPKPRRAAVHRVCMLATTPLRQVDIARAVGVSQQAIATMSKVAEFPHTPMEPAARRETLAQWAATGSWAPQQPSLVRTHWYGLESPLRLAQAAVKLAGELEVQTAVTGEVAADQLHPWRVPTRADIYASELIDLSVVGLHEASEQEANLTLLVPADDTVLRTAAWWSRERAATERYPAKPHLPTADPVVVLRDLEAVTPLADGAAENMSEWIATR